MSNPQQASGNEPLSPVAIADRSGQSPSPVAIANRPRPLWPPPWWSVLSLVVLVGMLAVLVWAGLQLSERAAPAEQLPTPILITVTPGGTPGLGGGPGATPASSALFDPGDVVRVKGTGGLELRVRAGPGVLYETLQLIPEGTRLEIMGEARLADEYLWWPVRNPISGIQGWVVSDYLEGW